MKFLTEAAETAEVLTEPNKDGSKRMYIAGPFLMFDKANRNGRIYPQKVMDEAVKSYKRDYIDTNRALNELNHPTRIQVDPERACVMTTELTKDGSYYYGKAKVLSTPLGKLLENLLNDGVKIGVSSRGAGNVSNQGKHKIVQPGYIITASNDIVFDPSVTEAFVDHLMEEKEYLLIGDKFIEQDMYIEQQKIKATAMNQLHEAKLKAFQNFMDKISSK